MKTFVILAISALAIGALAAPTPEESDFIEACGIKIGVTKEEFEELESSSEKAKCYKECKLERSGVMKDGHFNEEYKNYHKKIAEESTDDIEKFTSMILADCFNETTQGGCEGAQEYTQCVTAGNVAIVLLKSFTDLAEAYAEKPDE